MVLGSLAVAMAATDTARLAALRRRRAHRRTITDEDSKAEALRGLAVAVAATFDRAERIANTVVEKDRKARALGPPGDGDEATDPDRAERIANTIIEKDRKAEALGRLAVAMAMAATDPDRAAWLLGDAERIAHSITDEPRKAAAMSGIAEVMAATDPDRAERIAQSHHRRRPRTGAERGRRGVAATDPDRANTITNERSKVAALSRNREGTFHPDGFLQQLILYGATCSRQVPSVGPPQPGNNGDGPWPGTSAAATAD